MSIDEGLLEWVKEALEPLGTVSLRKMMGGGTLYLDGHDWVSSAPHCSDLSVGPAGPIIFAIMVDGELWFKADEESNAAWDEAGHTERFSVTFKDGTVDRMNYRRAPTDVYDDPDEMRRWTGLALEAGARRKVKKPKQKKSS